MFTPSSLGRSLVLSLILGFTSLAAWAQEGLSAVAIEAYIKSLPKVEAMGQRMEEEGRNQAWLQEVVPQAGEAFNPHQRGVALLQTEAALEYAELTGIVTAVGFTSAERWAEVGDQIILAYGALKAEQESPQLFAMASEFQGVNPQMLAMLPPEMRLQVEQAMQIVQAFSQVPVSDRDALRPYLGRIDHLLNR